MLPKVIKVLSTGSKYKRGSEIAKLMGTKTAYIGPLINSCRKTGYDITTGEKGYTLRPSTLDRYHDIKKRVEKAGGNFANGVVQIDKLKATMSKELKGLFEDWKKLMAHKGVPKIIFTDGKEV